VSAHLKGSGGGGVRPCGRLPCPLT